MGSENRKYKGRKSARLICSLKGRNMWKRSTNQTTKIILDTKGLRNWKQSARIWNLSKFHQQTKVNKSE